MSKTKRFTVPGWLGTAFFSVAAGSLFAGLLFLLLSFVLVKGELPASLAFAFSTAAFCGGCFFTGYTAARIRKSGGLLCGFLSFLFFAAAICAIALCAGNLQATSGLLFRCISLLISGCLGGLLGLHRVEQTKRLRRTA